MYWIISQNEVRNIFIYLLQILSGQLFSEMCFLLTIWKPEIISTSPDLPAL
jgi:hypothetical protein